MASSDQKLDILELREDLANDFLRVIDSVRGKKVLVLDESLLGLIDLISKFATLQEHGLQKVYKLAQENNYSNVDTQTNILYILRPTMKNASWISDHIKENTENNKHFSYNMRLVPKRTLLFEKVLEEAGVLGELVIDDFPLLLVPLEKDLLVMNLENSFKETYLDGDFSSIYHTAESLMIFQSKFGIFPRIVGKGDCAQLLADNLIQMRNEMAAIDNSGTLWTGWVLSTTFDSLVIFDRGIDLVTPLLTQLTYRGLLDEYYHITDEAIQVSVNTTQSENNAQAQSSPKSNNPPSSTGVRKKKLTLNESDIVFNQLKDKSFTQIGTLLSQMSKDLQGLYDSRHKAKSVKEVKAFVKGLGQLQAEQASLQSHVSATSTLIQFTKSEEFAKILEIEQNLVNMSEITSDQLKYLEQAVALGNLWNDGNKPTDAGKYRSDNRIAVLLRVVCLYFLIKGDSVKRKLYESFYNSLINSFGYQHVITMQRLNYLGMFGHLKQESAGFGSSYFFRRTDISSKKGKSLQGENNAEGNNANSSAIANAKDNSNRYTVPSTKPTSATRSDVFGFLRRDLNTTGTKSTPRGNVGAEASENPDSTSDLAQIYGGYVPITIRLMQCLARDDFISDSQNKKKGAGGVVSGWRGWDDVLGNIAGAKVDVTQTSALGNQNNVSLQEPRVGLLKQKATMVMFFGGITYSEIACIRLLSKLHNHQYIIATTNIINGTSFISQILTIDN